ncbi:hybrid sensor histidine kinase/response regulator, partial [Caulobacter sp. 17J65-9]|nr:hybrid sensor histidine kinase/response regulator [Caulobacter sp. 17J65-9]
MSRAPNRSSVARKLVLGVIGLSILVSTLAAVAAFAVFYDKAARQQVTSLSHYVDERLVVEERLFSDLRTVHAAATGALLRRLPALDGPELDRQFDAFFPLQADGTRRSAPALFDGRNGPAGDRIYGLGGFLADGRNVSREDKALMLAAARAVAEVGEAHLGRYDNLYFFTPSDRQVMFGPERDDRLMFYRKNAPADFTMQPLEAGQIALPSVNPARVTRCTKLQQLVYRPGKGQPRGTGCITPLDIGGRHVGAFGTTVLIDEKLLGSAADRLPGSATLIVSETGELIASPGYRAAATRPEDVAAGKVLERMDETLARIRAAGGRHGVVESPDHDALVAYGQMFGPSWRLLIVLPKSAVLRTALESALTVLVAGLLAVGLLSTVALVLIRRSVVKPLEALAAWAGARGRGAPLEAVEARTDEIGALARA